MTGPLCRKCGSILAPYLLEQGEEYHVLCHPNPAALFDAPPHDPKLSNGDSYALHLRDEITDIIKWANRSSDRSQQVEIGASETGGECLRRLGYRIAEVASVNEDTDPWPAIVGTAIHSWLEKAVDKFQAAHRLNRWATEMTVHPSDVVTGHTDLYDKEKFAVVDYKSAGTEKMRDLRKGVEGAVSPDHIQQINLYGLGHVRAGRRVDTVALVYLPRAGWLSGMYVWSAPFDQQLAEDALDRLKKVAAGLIYYKVTDNGENWNKIPATAGKGCAWCPWLNPGVDEASAAGCPGK